MGNTPGREGRGTIDDDDDYLRSNDRHTQNQSSISRSTARNLLDQEGFGGTTSPQGVDRLLAEAGLDFSGDGEADTEQIPRSAVLNELDELQEQIYYLKGRINKISAKQETTHAVKDAIAYRLREIGEILQHRDIGPNSVRPAQKMSLRRERRQLTRRQGETETASEALATRIQAHVESLAAKQLRLKHIHQQVDFDFRTARAMVQCMFAPDPVPAGPFLETDSLAALDWGPAIAALHEVAREKRHSAEAAGRQLMSFIKTVYAIGGNRMTADDLLPVFIFCLVSTNPGELTTPLRLFSTLQTTTKTRSSELEYYCTSLVLALIFIVQQQRVDMRDTRLFTRLRAAMETLTRRREAAEQASRPIVQPETNFVGSEVVIEGKPKRRLSLAAPTSTAGARPRQRSKTTTVDVRKQPVADGNRPWLNLHDMRKILRQRQRRSARRASLSLAALIGTPATRGGASSAHSAHAKVVHTQSEDATPSPGIFSKQHHHDISEESDDSSSSDSTQDSPGFIQRKPLERSVSMLADNFLRRRKSLSLIRRPSAGVLTTPRGGVDTRSPRLRLNLATTTSKRGEDDDFDQERDQSDVEEIDDVELLTDSSQTTPAPPAVLDPPNESHV